MPKVSVVKLIADTVAVVLTAVGTLILAVFTCYLYLSQENANDINRRNNEDSRRVQRAYVSMLLDFSKQDQEPLVGVTATLKNTSYTTALNGRYDVAIAYTEGTDPEEEAFRVLNQTTDSTGRLLENIVQKRTDVTISPQESRFIAGKALYRVNFRSTDQDPKTIDTDERGPEVRRRLYIIGHFDYKDIYGLSHVVMFCRQILGSVQGLYSVYCRKYNYST